MTVTPRLVIVVAGPGALQDGLLAVVTTIPRIQVVLVAEDPPQMLERIAGHRPGLVIVDMALLGEEAGVVLEQIADTSPSTRCIVLADDVQQQRAAEEASACAVLIKGYPVAKLVETIEMLLDREERRE